MPGPEPRPTIALLRPRDRLDAACREAAAVGFEPLPVPLLEAVALDPARMDRAVAALAHGAPGWVVVGSDRAVQALWGHAASQGRDSAALLARWRVVAIGSVTQASLRERGVASACPEAHSSAGVLALLASEGVRGQTAVLLRSEQGSEELPRGLAALGAQVVEAPVYALRLPEDLAEARALVRRAVAGGVDAWAFGSPQTVANLLEVARRLGLAAALRSAVAGAAVGAIGLPTEAALGEHGVRCDVVVPEARFEGLLAALRSVVPEPVSDASRPRVGPISPLRRPVA